MTDTNTITPSIEARVNHVISEQLGCVGPEPTDRLVGDLGADSLDRVELVMALEEEFDVQIPDEEAEKIETVQQIIDAIKARRSA